MFKYYRKLNFSKISTRVRLMFDVHSLFTEVSKAFPCERKLHRNFHGLSKNFHSRNFCAVPRKQLYPCLISLYCHTATGVTHMHSMELIPPPCFELQCALVVLRPLHSFAPCLLASALLFVSSYFRAKKFICSGSQAWLHFSMSTFVKWA